MTGDAQGRQDAAGRGRQLLQHASGNALADAKNGSAGVLGQFRPGDRGQVIAFASDAQLLTQPIDERAGTAGRRSERFSRATAAALWRDCARPSVAGSAGRPAGGSARHHRCAEVVDAVAVFRAGRSTRNEADGSLRRRSAEPNWFVESVNAPRSVYQPKKVRIQAMVAGAGTEAGGDERLAAS